MPAAYRTDRGHLAMDRATGATVLVPHDGPTVQLQGIGRVAAKPAGELVPGDVTVWNYGYRYTVVSVVPTGSASVTVTSRDERTGAEYTRRHGRGRLVAIGSARRAARSEPDAVDDFDPDPTTYGPHPFDRDAHGYCRTCGREYDATMGAMTDMHTDRADYDRAWTDR